MKSDGLPDRTLRAGGASTEGFVPEPILLEDLFRTVDRQGSSTEVATGCVLDREAIVAQVEGDMDLLVELVELFLATYPSQLREIRDGLSDHDSTRVREAAHSLKGSVGNFQATAAVELAHTLEGMGRDGNLNDARQVLTELETEMTRVKTALADMTIEIAS